MTQTFTTRIRHILELVRFSHSLFALPFALAAMLVAAQGWPGWKIFLFILLAMITARNAAMAHNRYADAEIDAQNPRTQNRHIPRGLVTKRFALIFSLTNAVLFVVVSSQFNVLTFMLSPLVLAVLYLYSYCKRFTAWSHVVLGAALGISPIGAWIAVTGEISGASVLLGLGVLFWVAGFDILYALPDEGFDRSAGLHSLVVKFGAAKALFLSRAFHGLTILLLVLFGEMTGLGVAYQVTMGIIALTLIVEQSLVGPGRLGRLNAAFFTANGIISLVYLAGVLVALG